MSVFLADGIGASLGDSLTMDIGFVGLGVHSVWYVSSVIGVDASGRGRNREAPFATIEYAIGQAVDGDTIVPLADHAEATTGHFEIDKSVVIAAEGSAAGVPTSVWGVSFGGSDEVLNVSADNVEIRNVKFTANASNLTFPRIEWVGDDGLIKGCRFEAATNDDGPVLLVTGDNLTVQSSTFISTATTLATRPEQAVRTANASITMFRMKDCVVSGGASGWASENGAVWVRCDGGCVRIEGMSLLLGSDIVVDTGTYTGFIGVPTSTGGGQIRGV